MKYLLAVSCLLAVILASSATPVPKPIGVGSVGSSSVSVKKSAASTVGAFGEEVAQETTTVETTTTEEAAVSPYGAYPYGIYPYGAFPFSPYYLPLNHPLNPLNPLSPYYRSRLPYPYSLPVVPPYVAPGLLPPVPAVAPYVPLL